MLLLLPCQESLVMQHAALDRIAPPQHHRSTKMGGKHVSLSSLPQLKGKGSSPLLNHQSFPIFSQGRWVSEGSKSKWFGGFVFWPVPHRTVAQQADWFWLLVQHHHWTDGMMPIGISGPGSGLCAVSCSAAFVAGDSPVSLASPTGACSGFVRRAKNLQWLFSILAPGGHLPTPHPPARPP